MIAFFRKRYGSTPLHLLGHVVVILVAIWAVPKMLDAGKAWRVGLWFLAGAVLHDVLFVPAHQLLDRIARGGSGRGPGDPVAVINYLRFPTAISGVLLLVYWPRILEKVQPTSVADTGHTVSGVLDAWLLVTAGLFLVSSLLYALAMRRAMAARDREQAAGPAS